MDDLNDNGKATHDWNNMTTDTAKKMRLLQYNNTNLTLEQDMMSHSLILYTNKVPVQKICITSVPIF